MVKILYVEGDPSTRDAIKVALEQFKGFEGTFVAPEEFPALARPGRFHVVFIEDAPDPLATFHRLDAVSRQDTRLPAVVIVDEENVRMFIQDKKRLNISTFLRKPLDPVDIFRLLARLKHKIGAMDLTRA